MGDNWWEDIGELIAEGLSDSGGTDIDIVVTQDQELISIPTTEIYVDVPATQVNVNMDMDALADVTLVSEVMEEQRFRQEQASRQKTVKKITTAVFLVAAIYAIKTFWGKI